MHLPQVPSKTYSVEIMHDVAPCAVASRARTESGPVAFASHVGDDPPNLAPSTFVHAAALMTTSISSHGRSSHLLSVRDRHLRL